MTQTFNPTIAGKTWIFGDSIDTDAMYPAFAMKLDVPEASKHVFYQVRPGWTDQVSPGDIVIAGRNFGVGSSRPVANLLRYLGVAALIADGFNSLFFRNAINAGLPALTLPDATQVFHDGDWGSFNIATGEYRNDSTGAVGQTAPLPPLIVEILASGGVLARLAEQGYLPAELLEMLRTGAISQEDGSGA
jgi:3-isopropylmalate/(R)-2-methylmalate dehydratase small subunit